MPLPMLYAGDGEQIVTYDRLAGSAGLAVRATTPVPEGVRSFCFAPNKLRLYVGSTKALFGFSVDPATGTLSPLGSPVPVPDPPCYLTTDKDGRFLLVASYSQPGTASVFKLGAADGAVTGPAVSRVETRNTSHFINVDPSNRFAFVPSVAAANHKR